MTKITKQEFKSMTPKNGGDLWNTYKLCSIAFNKFPEAEVIQFSLGTGLWAEIQYTTNKGDLKSGTIYEHEPMKKNQ